MLAPNRDYFETSPVLNNAAFLSKMYAAELEVSPKRHSFGYPHWEYKTEVAAPENRDLKKDPDITANNLYPWSGISAKPQPL